MFLLKQARREARALVVAALFGGGFGLAVGGAYLAGGLANAAADRAQVASLTHEAGQGFSGRALALRVGTMDPSALAIAQRYDPYNLSGEFQRSRQGLILIDRLDSSDAAHEMRASIDAVGPAAEPFEPHGALQSSRDLDCLTTAVYFEARGESAAGQAAVAQVVLNRVRHPAYPRTICGVVFQGAASRGCQFSFACNGAMRGRREPGAWSRSRDVAIRAMSGYVMTSIGNATNFHTTHVAPGWNNMVRVSQVGSHIFYRFAGRNGSAVAFNAHPMPSDGADSPATAPIGDARDASVRTTGYVMSANPTRSGAAPAYGRTPVPPQASAATEASASAAATVTSQSVTPASSTINASPPSAS